MENKSTYKSLSRRADFLNLKAKGRSVHINTWLLVNMQKTERGEFRCGFTLPRQTGGAIVRNRLRRWGKEFLRRWAKKNHLSLDVNLIFKRQEKGFYATVAHPEFDEVMEKLVAKLTRYAQ